MKKPKRRNCYVATFRANVNRGDGRWGKDEDGNIRRFFADDDVTIALHAEVCSYVSSQRDAAKRARLTFAKRDLDWFANGAVKWRLIGVRKLAED